MSALRIPNSNPLLTQQDKQHLMQWVYSSHDESITSYYLDPFWRWLVDTYVPMNVAPNALTLIGFLCIVIAFGLHMSDAVSTAWIALLIFAYQSLDSMDGKQARRLGNSTAAGELLDHGCDAMTTTLLCLIMVKLLGITDLRTVWFLVQAGQMMFLSEHMRALLNPGTPIVFPKWTGPGEALLLVEIILVVNAVLGGVPCVAFVRWTAGWFSMIMYVTSFVTTINDLFSPPSSVVTLSHESRMRLITCACCVAVARYGEPAGLSEVLAQGLAFTVITGEVILCKMARPRQIHPVVIVTTAASLFCSAPLSIVATVCYWFWVIYDFLTSNDLPLVTVFTPRSRVV